MPLGSPVLPVDHYPTFTPLPAILPPAQAYIVTYGLLASRPDPATVHTLLHSIFRTRHRGTWTHHTLVTLARSFNKYSQITASALRRPLNETERLAAERRGATNVGCWTWENGQGGQQVRA